VSDASIVSAVAVPAVRQVVPTPVVVNVAAIAPTVTVTHVDSVPPTAARVCEARALAAGAMLRPIGAQRGRHAAATIARAHAPTIAGAATVVSP